MNKSNKYSVFIPIVIATIFAIGMLLGYKMNTLNQPDSNVNSGKNKINRLIKKSGSSQD